MLYCTGGLRLKLRHSTQVIMYSRVPWSAGIVALTALTLACTESHGPTGPITGCPAATQGSFTANVTGARTGQAIGCAQYAVLGQGSITIITLSDFLSAPPVTLAFSRSGNLPGVGTYNVDSTSATAFRGSFEFLQDQKFAFASGTVSVTASGSGILASSFSVIATDAEAGQSLTVTGTFTAVCLAGC
jgi:hypothetical protein